jgi:4-hydroxybenzoate polyprenyltransferase
MFDRIINNITSLKISISNWTIAFVGVVFMRFFLEFFSNPSYYGGSITSDASTLIHYALFYFVTLISIVLVVWYLSKRKPGLQNLFLFGLPLIWLSPVIDILFSSGKGFVMTYMFDAGPKLLLAFLTFFGPKFNYGATIGIRIEIFVILCFIGFFVWQVRRKFWPVILAVVFSYTIIFVFYSIPGVIYTISHIKNLQLSYQTEVTDFLQRSIVNSNIGQNIQDGLVTYGSYNIFLEFGANRLYSQIFFLLSFCLLGLWFFKTQKQKFLAVITNSRPERVLFYWLLVLAGLLGSFFLGFGVFRSWVDIMSLTTLLISWYGAWMFSVHTNDIADIKIDSITSLNRPIINNTLSVDDTKQTAIIWFLVSLVGSFVVGYYPFFMNIVFLSAYYIYSVPPLRFKKIPILSSFSISIACLSSIVAGFFFLSADKNFTIFSPILALGIMLVFTLGVNIRDIKDVAGDKEDDILTLPVLFSRNGEKIVATLFAISFLLIPFIISFYTLYIIAIPTAFIGYKMVLRKPYKEKYVFAVCFSFFFITVLFISSLLLFAQHLHF